MEHETQTLGKDIKLYTVQEVADILNLDQRTIYSYIKDKEIKARKIGRKWLVSHKDLEFFVKGSESNI